MIKEKKHLMDKLGVAISAGIEKSFSKVLAELIEYDNNILFKGTKLVEYNGPYIRLKK